MARYGTIWERWNDGHDEKYTGWLLLGLAACGCTKQQSERDQAAGTVAARPVSAEPEKKGQPALVGIIQRLPLMKPEYRDTVRWNPAGG
jgi:hypothetical protein